MFDNLIVFSEDFFEKVDFEISQQTESLKNHPACDELKLWWPFSSSEQNGLSNLSRG